MLTHRQRLILDMFRQRISEDEFLRQVEIQQEGGSAFALKMLEDAYHEKGKVDVESGLGLAFHFGMSPDFLDILIRLSDAEWHERHEDVVTALDELRDVRTIDALHRAAIKLHGYLDYDDSRALAGKAIWALGKLGVAKADERLRSLAELDDAVVSMYAREQLYRRIGRSTPEERERGNALCVRIDGEKDQMLRAQLLRELRELNDHQKAEKDRWMAEQGWRDHKRS